MWAVTNCCAAYVVLFFVNKYLMNPNVSRQMTEPTQSILVSDPYDYVVVLSQIPLLKILFFFNLYDYRVQSDIFLLRFI